jgi:5-formyltetrahydrofolate cyclo-ligase
MDKQQIRNEIRNILLSMDKPQYDQLSNAICEQLLQDPSIIKGKTIAVTISSFPEVNTWPLIESLWDLGKHVVVPKCNAKTREMTFYTITNFSQTENVYMGLLEPIPTLCEPVNKNEIDVCIVPGIVFDIRGYRIGYGGGYYDRFLNGYKGKIISLAFHSQLVDFVPNHEYDLPIEQLITNEAIMYFSKEGSNVNEKYD